MPSIRKILIANRGEIAVRVTRTCREMGISTTAVYSDADLHSLHVRQADEAVRIGSPAPSDSYLNIEAIITAAKRTNADAIHPGYGFLSENPDFASACAEAGIVFIGPSPDCIRTMALKSVARKTMAAAGLPIVPGYDGDDQSLPVLRSKALEIGLPALIKATAGGGGRGMRVVRSAIELDQAIESARREAENAFGNGALLIEKYVERSRHIEVQILGDHAGNIIHLFERDCSIQRRHQKLVEESPSPAIFPELRRRICEAAVAAGRALKYSNAGTVEFLLAPAGEFYFIEVNTRLQVEHPVTEMVTGLDLVRLQIEIAEGQPLPLKQEDIRQNGCAIEARLYAEDPANNFLPASGRILDWLPPGEIGGLRIDSGIERGAEIGIFYDSLLAKLIARGANRTAAVRRLAYALRETTVHGLKTNREFLIRLLEHPAFEAGEFHSEFVSERIERLTSRADDTDDKIAAAVVALFVYKTREAGARILPNVAQDFRNNPYRDPSIRLQVESKTMVVIYRKTGADTFVVTIDDWQSTAQVVAFEPGGADGPSAIRVAFDGVQQLIRMADLGGQYYVTLPSGTRVVTRLARYPAAQPGADVLDASAPMPGLVARVLVSIGQEVRAGDPLVVLEAMKMEQTLRAATDGIVEAVMVRQGEVVAPGDVLVHIGAR
jgi:acetyl-CoA carboxylase biotin carboxylase subunit